MNHIIDILKIKDKNIKIINCEIVGTNQIVTLEKELEEHICPKCASKMYSKGIKVRTIRHPILQDGYHLILKLRHRRWECINPSCKYSTGESYSFVDKGKRTTNSLILQVIEAYRDINKTSVEIAKQFNISDHLAMDIFKEHVQLERLTLPEIICVDEVYLDMDKYCKYVLVLQDFFTGEPIDLVKSRQERVTEPYFRNIPYKERCNVKYLISDMYNPYINYTKKYFPNALSVVDSFHVMQWLLASIDKYCRSLLRKFKQRDETKAIEVALSKNKDVDLNNLNIPLSDEVYLLQKHRWVMLKNQDNIDYYAQGKYNRHFKAYVDLYFLEDKFLSIDDKLNEMRELKELYVNFNKRNAGNLETAKKELTMLINVYEDCGIEIFNNFAKTLRNHYDSIINSFILSNRIIKGEIKSSRLSNGPIEALNRKAKDLKRSGNGYVNFNNLRNRFLFATRKDALFRN